MIITYHYTLAGHLLQPLRYALVSASLRQPLLLSITLNVSRACCLASMLARWLLRRKNGYGGFADTLSYTPLSLLRERHEDAAEATKVTSALLCYLR